MKKNILTISFTLTLFSLPFYLSTLLPASSNTGTDACSFLKMDTGARPVAMAGAFSGIADDANSIQYNPAGISQINKSEITLSHNEWIEDIRSEYLGYIQPINKSWTLGLAMNYLYTSGLVKRDIYGNELGETFGGNDGSSSITLSKKINKDVFVGTNLKIIREALDEKKDIAYASDFGLLYKLSKLQIGLVAQNIGTKIKLYQDSFSLPITFRVGLGYKFAKNTTIGFDIIKSIDNKTDFRLGGEYWLFDILAFRAGYKFNPDENTGKGINAGAGLKYKNYQADFGFVPFGDFGNIYRMSMTIRFDSVTP
ncbi:MAG: hypothetical protein A2539_03040 [Elusimicrobia bacterium RIFOXYD2_FULL_34_15]|nr:MAG: hypothetical protein A2539_03040 [Elusimicrobia bacterium RIFOXYD2_FULL_34_15]